MPSSNKLTLRVQNLRLVSPLPKEELFEPCSADARSLDPCHAGQTLNVTLRIHGSDTMALKLIGFDPETQLSHQRPGFFGGKRFRTLLAASQWKAALCGSGFPQVIAARLSASRSEFRRLQRLDPGLP